MWIPNDVIKVHGNCTRKKSNICLIARLTRRNFDSLNIVHNKRPNSYLETVSKVSEFNLLGNQVFSFTSYVIFSFKVSIHKHETKRYRVFKHVTLYSIWIKCAFFAIIKLSDSQIREERKRSFNDFIWPKN